MLETTTIDNHQPHWYAVRVKSNRERVTGDALRGRGVDAIVPEYHRPSVRRGRERMIPQPLFPGYVFGRFSEAMRIPVMCIPGVVHVVGIGGRPQPINPEEMQRVLRVTEAQLDVTPHPYLPPGQTVRLQQGPLKGMDGIVVNDDGQPRLVVSVTLLQRSVAVLVERQWIGGGAFEA